MQGSLGGLAEASAGRHEIVAFAPTSIRGPGRIGEALAGIDVELRTWPVPFSHAVRTAWSGPRPPVAERLLRAVRRPPLLGLDVSAAAQRGAGDDDPRSRPIHHPEWTTARTLAMHAPEVPQRGARSATSCSCNSEYTGRDVAETLGVAPDRIRVAHPAPKDVYRPTARLPISAAPVRAHGRDARAAQEPAGAASRRSACSTASWSSRSWARKAGASSRSSTAGGDPPARLRSDDELARLYRGAAVVAYPPASRVSDPGDRGDGVRLPRRRLVARRRSTRRAARRRCAPTPRIRPRSRPRSSTPGRRGSRPSELGAEHARSFSWRAVGEVFLAWRTRRHGAEGRPGDRRRRASRGHGSSSSCGARPNASVLEPRRGGSSPRRAPQQAAARELLEETGLRAEVEGLAALARRTRSSTTRPRSVLATGPVSRRSPCTPSSPMRPTAGSRSSTPSTTCYRWCDLDVGALALLPYEDDSRRRSAPLRGAA